MKKIVIPAMAAIIASPALAGHQSTYDKFMEMDPYIALRLGAGYTNLNYSFNNNKESITDEDLHGRVALGLTMCNTARTEIEWSMFTKIKDSAGFGLPDGVNVDVKLQTLLMNVYMDFGDYQIVRPFVGVGAGVAFADVTRSVPGAGSFGHDQTRFSAMGSIGLAFDWKIFAVDMAFRYTYADVNSGLHNFGGDIGLRYMF